MLLMLSTPWFVDMLPRTRIARHPSSVFHHGGAKSMWLPNTCANGAWGIIECR